MTASGNQNQSHFGYLLKGLKYTLAVCGPALGALWVWGLFSPASYTEKWALSVSGIAYNPYTIWEKPHSTKLRISHADKDLKDLGQITSRIRTYSSGEFLDHLAIVAQQNNIDIIAGAWVGVDPKHDSEEISSLIALSKIHTNIERLVIGNETLLREDLSSAQLRQHISTVKSETALPVSTAEPWHIWIDNPELAQSVDFLAVHILPYWEGVPAEDGISYIDTRLRELRNTYPDKPILLAEVGWPSAGPKRNHARPSLISQAIFLRAFVQYASKTKLEYIWMEAYDQPWKIAQEGRVGSHWGLFTADRKAKWKFGDFIIEKSHWQAWALFSVVVGSFLQTMFLRTWHTIPLIKLISIGICFQLISAGAVIPFLMAFEQYLGPLEMIVWFLLSIAQIPLWMLLTADLVEFSNIVCKNQTRLLQIQRPSEFQKHSPHVSIHLPCSYEPPEIVIESLYSLSQLDYPSYEVVVVSNNCTNEACWRPIEEACAKLGQKFRFLHTDYRAGYKAGALNLARELSSTLTEIIAVVDSDYLVKESWLRRLVPAFEQANIGIVQAPQDHRSELSTSLQKGCFWEYSGFFQIGMVQRNEANAIIQHGTMTLVRLKALDEVGGWSEWCLTEDAELGLKLFQRGWDATYTRKSFGKGLLPPNFEAYRTQRFRWAYGGIQILRHHFLYLTGLRKSALTWPQKYHFLAGWLPWMSDLGGLVFGIAALCWTVTMSISPEHFPPPSSLFLLPVLGFLILRQTRNNVLYRLRVNCSYADRLRAAVAGLSLSHSIARAVFFGVTGWKNIPFVRTPKMGTHRSIWVLLRGIRAEMFLLSVTLGATVLFCLRTGLDDRLEMLWTLILLGQSLPYICALQMVLGEAKHHRTTRLTMIDQKMLQTSADKSIWKRKLRTPGS
jgi:exo-beta-1,3-glucanase (GH17 family)/cellulose synthase/poly-beta-1,6-N-acetylglucosamine synthase-like glycosyltransferase